LPKGKKQDLTLVPNSRPDSFIFFSKQSDFRYARLSDNGKGNPPSVRITPWSLPPFKCKSAVFVTPRVLTVSASVLPLIVACPVPIFHPRILNIVTRYPSLFLTSSYLPIPPFQRPVSFSSSGSSGSAALFFAALGLGALFFVALGLGALFFVALGLGALVSVVCAMGKTPVPRQV
jgi:hypothetical protein